MSFDEHALYNLQLLPKPVSVSLPNGYKVQVNHCGKLKIDGNLVSCQVLLVPHFKYNLVSIKNLVRQLQHQVIFIENLCEEASGNW